MNKLLPVSLLVLFVCLLIGYPQPTINHEDTVELAAASQSPSAGVYPYCDTVVVITGATSGIGLALTTKLYELGAGNIVAVGRSKSKLDSLSTTLEESYPNAKGKLVPVIADLNDLNSVSHAADVINRRFKRIDYLVNNAGLHLTQKDLVSSSPVLTEQGYEMTFGVNYLSHFLLTEKLLPSLERSRNEARIIQVSSSFHWLSNASALAPSADGLLPPFASRGDISSYISSVLQRFRSYSFSKLAQILHMRALNEELSSRKKKTSVRVLSVCPGWVGTSIGRSSEVAERFMKLTAFPADGYGLQSVLNAMFHPVPNGDYLVNSNFFEVKIISLTAPLWTSSLASVFLLRDAIVWCMAISLYIFQKFFSGAYVVGTSSSDSLNVDVQSSLYEWSKGAVAQWM